MAPKISVVVVAYDMPREIPRTIRSLSPPLQRNIAPEDYEILVVDNGSSAAFDRNLCERWGAQVRFLDVPSPNASPAAAVNFGVRNARGDLVGAMIDGARMASSGLIAGARDAARLHPKPIVASLGFHIGPGLQPQTIQRGYDARAEDALLAESRWEEDSDNLFDIAVFAGSSLNGWFAPIAESNALFMKATEWELLGGCDERFSSPGGGLVNLDLYRRACALPDSRLFMLLGEGTFHQVHGGVSANSPTSRWPEFHAEYVEIRGEPFAAPKKRATFVGSLSRQALAHVETSARRAQETE